MNICSTYRGLFKTSERKRKSRVPKHQTDCSFKSSIVFIVIHSNTVSAMGYCDLEGSIEWINTHRFTRVACILHTVTFLHCAFSKQTICNNQKQSSVSVTGGIFSKKDSSLRTEILTSLWFMSNQSGLSFKWTHCSLEDHLTLTFSKLLLKHKINRKASTKNKRQHLSCGLSFDSLNDYTKIPFFIYLFGLEMTTITVQVLSLLTSFGFTQLVLRSGFGISEPSEIVLPAWHLYPNLILQQ